MLQRYEKLEFLKISTVEISNVKLLKLQSYLHFVGKHGNNISVLDKTGFDYHSFFDFKFLGRCHVGFHDVIWLFNCFRQKNFCSLTIAATV